MSQINFEIPLAEFIPKETNHVHRICDELSFKNRKNRCWQATFLAEGGLLRMKKWERAFKSTEERFSVLYPSLQGLCCDCIF